MDELRAQASDPSTPGLDLQQLATNAQLRPLIARNPAAYTGLLNWLIEKNEPEVLAALRERQAAFDAGQMMPMPSVPIPSPPETENPTEPEAPATPSLETPAETDAPQLQTPATPDCPATPASADNHSTPPTRTSILGQNPGETTVLPPINTPTSAPVSTAGLPPSYPPTGAASPNEGTGSYATVAPAVAQTQYMAPVTGNIPLGNAAGNPYPQVAVKPQSNAGLWAIFTVLLLAVIGMIVAIALVMTGTVGGGEAQTETSSPSAAPSPKSESPTPEQTATSDESPRQTVAPAPAGAQSMQSFVTETGDSTCRVDGDELTCQVRNLIADVAGCAASQDALVINLADGDPSVSCQPNQDYSPSGDIIAHDTAMTYGDFACQSTYTGTECWNTITGKGFFFAKQDYHQRDTNVR